MSQRAGVAALTLPLHHMRGIPNSYCLCFSWRTPDGALVLRPRSVHESPDVVAVRMPAAPCTTPRDRSALYRCCLSRGDATWQYSRGVSNRLAALFPSLALRLSLLLYAYPPFGGCLRYHI